MKSKIPNVYKPTIDKGIYGAIVYLNNLGFKTTYSCSGHGVEKGYIAFKGICSKVEKQIIEQILRTRYGAWNCKWADQHRSIPRTGTFPSSSIHFRLRKK